MLPIVHNYVFCQFLHNHFHLETLVIGKVDMELCRPTLGLHNVGLPLTYHFNLEV